jgi:2-keto-4-pentenoate hydratase
MDDAAVHQAARNLIDARRSGRLLEELPLSCRPSTVDEAHAIQDATVVGLHDAVAGWKVASGGDGEVVRGIILQSRVFATPARISASLVPLLGVEAEIAFRFDRALPARDRAYTYDEVADAVSALPAIEVVDSRFRSYRDAPVLQRFADCVSNGAFVQGVPQPGWRGLDLKTIEVTLTIDSREIVHRLGGHPTGDPLLPAVALVNHLRTREGVAPGRLMTTGTYTGLNYAKPGQAVTAIFAGFGAVQVEFTV